MRDCYKNKRQNRENLYKNRVNFIIVIRDLLSLVWLHGLDYLRNMENKVHTVWEYWANVI